MPKERLYMRIEQNLNQAAQRYAEDHGGISKSAVISQALAEFLRENGYLPPLPPRPGNRKSGGHASSRSRLDAGESE